MSTGPRRYLNDGDLLPDDRVYVLASDYDALARERDSLQSDFDDLLEQRRAEFAESESLRAQLRASREAAQHARPYMAINVYCANDDEDHFRMACRMVDAALQSTPQLAKNEGEKT